MALIHLTTHTAFDQTDGAGVLLDGRSGAYLELDACQSLMLAALLTSPSWSEAVARLSEETEAGEAELAQALTHFLCQLVAQGLVQMTDGRPTGEHDTSDPPAPSLHAWEDAQDTASAETGNAHPVSRSTSSSAPVWEKNADPSWEFFVTGEMELPPLPGVSLGRRLSAISQGVRILLLYRRFSGGPWLLHVDRALEGIRARQPLSPDPWTQLRLARREILFSQVATRLFTPRGRCIPRSLALCAYLRCLGLPARFVIGRARFSFDAHEFHAWTEVAGWAVNETDELVSGYSLLLRVPNARGEGDPVAPSNAGFRNHRKNMCD
jgi:hypothetical protein